VLWFIGGELAIPVGSTMLRIPGFLVIAAFLYAVLASGSMVSIARGFVVVAENKNQAEADYRYALTRLRENGESIAMLGGENEERAGLDAAFTTVRRRWRELMMQYIRTTSPTEKPAVDGEEGPRVQPIVCTEIVVRVRPVSGPPAAVTVGSVVVPDCDSLSLLRSRTFAAPPGRPATATRTWFTQATLTRSPTAKDPTSGETEVRRQVSL